MPDPQVPTDFFDRLNALGRMPGADPQTIADLAKRAGIVADRMNQPDPPERDSGAEAGRLFTRFHGGDLKEDDLYDSYAAGKLSKDHFSMLAGAINEVKTPQGQRVERARAAFFDQYRPVVDGTMQGMRNSPVGAARLFDLERDAREMERRVPDPMLLYDPRAAEYLGTIENIARYRPTMQDELRHRGIGYNMLKDAAQGHVQHELLDESMRR